jgi:hypothetical protein
MVRFAIAAVVFGITAGSARADEEEGEVVARERPRTPFDRGRLGLSLGGGSGTAYGERYYAIGGGAGYFILDGIELGASASHQFGAGPSISKLSPSLRYIAQPLVGRSPVIPYVGAFYTHWFIGDDFVDVDAIGTRVGGVLISGSLVIGLGIAFERIVSTCPMDGCWSIYPDFAISLSL